MNRWLSSRLRSESVASGETATPSASNPAPSTNTKPPIPTNSHLTSRHASSSSDALTYDDPSYLGTKSSNQASASASSSASAGDSAADPNNQSNPDLQISWIRSFPIFGFSPRDPADPRYEAIVKFKHLTTQHGIGDLHWTDYLLAISVYIELINRYRYQQVLQQQQQQLTKFNDGSTNPEMNQPSIQRRKSSLMSFTPPQMSHSAQPLSNSVAPTSSSSQPPPSTLFSLFSPVRRTRHDRRNTHIRHPFISQALPSIFSPPISLTSALKGARSKRRPWASSTCTLPPDSPPSWSPSSSPPSSPLLQPRSINFAAAAATSSAAYFTIATEPDFEALPPKIALDYSGAGTSNDVVNSSTSTVDFNCNTCKIDADDHQQSSTWAATRELKVEDVGQIYNQKTGSAPDATPFLKNLAKRQPNVDPDKKGSKTFTPSDKLKPQHRRHVSLPPDVLQFQLASLSQSSESEASQSENDKRADSLAAANLKRVHQLQLIYHMLRHAESVYGLPLTVTSAPGISLTKITDKGIICKRTGLSQKEFLMTQFSSQPFCPAFYVAVDTAAQAIVICVRGTAKFTDSLTDVAATQDPVRVRAKRSDEQQNRTHIHHTPHHRTLNHRRNDPNSSLSSLSTSSLSSSSLSILSPATSSNALGTASGIGGGAHNSSERPLNNGAGLLSSYTSGPFSKNMSSLLSAHPSGLFSKNMGSSSSNDRTQNPKQLSTRQPALRIRKQSLMDNSEVKKECDANDRLKDEGRDSDIERSNNGNDNDDCGNEIQDDDIDDEDYIRGLGHAGIVRSARNLADKVSDCVSQALSRDEYRGYAVVTTGHSLGAGTASILALILRDEMKFATNDAPIFCVAFAPPPCLTYEVAEAANDSTLTVVNGPDVVPRLSVAMLVPLLATARYVADLPRHKKSLVGLGVKGVVDWDDLYNLTMERMGELDRIHDGRRLFLPGKVLQVTRIEKKRRRIWKGNTVVDKRQQLNKEGSNTVGSDDKNENCYADGFSDDGDDDGNDGDEEMMAEGLMDNDSGSIQDEEMKKVILSWYLKKRIKSKEKNKKSFTFSRKWRHQYVAHVSRVPRTKFINIKTREKGMFLAHAPFSYRAVLSQALRNFSKSPVPVGGISHIMRKLIADVNSKSSASVWAELCR